MRILAIIILSLLLLASCKKETENNTDIVNDTITTDVKADMNNGSDEFTKRKVGDTIYGDFNGDGNLENAYRVLIKKGYGNPVEDGVPDEYEIHFSDKRIKPIKDNLYWFFLVNEGDLDEDGSDEISVREDPMNGCIGSVKVFTIKNGKTDYLFEPFMFYSGACDSEMIIEPEDLVENDNGTVYYYEYSADGVYEPNGGYSINGKGKKIFGKKVKAFGIKSAQDNDVSSDLPPAIEVINNSDNSKRGNKAGYINNEVYTDYPERDVEVQDNTIYNAAGLQIQPEYPGGINVFYEYVQRNFKRPKIDRATNLKVILSFIVEKDGSLTDIKVLKDPGYDAGIEVERMLKSVANKWKPGILNDKPIRAKYTLPVVINVQRN